MNVHNVNTLFCVVFTKTDKLRVNYVKKERETSRKLLPRRTRNQKNDAKVEDKAQWYFEYIQSQQSYVLRLVHSTVCTHRRLPALYILSKVICSPMTRLPVQAAI